MPQTTTHKLTKTGVITTVILALMVLGPGVQAKSQRHAHGINKIMGSITVHEGEQMGDLSSINGSIYLKSNATVDDAETVNGSIKIEDNVTMGSATTVNGSILAGTNLQVDGDVRTVNGEIRLASGTSVGQAETVNGSIDLDMTQVGSSVSTVNGNITLDNNSKVLGDIVFEENQSRFSRSRPRLTIDSTSSVSGTIHLYQEVILNISDSASVGEIIHHYK